MADWDLSIALDAKSSVPLYLQLTRGLIEAIAGGRLAKGSRLPGTRSLAGALRVHRNTVAAAYDELLAEGWIEARPRSGTFVSEALPDEIHPPPAPHGNPGRIRSTRKGSGAPSGGPIYRLEQP